MQTIFGLFIVLVIILSMGLQFSSKEGFTSLAPKSTTNCKPSKNSKSKSKKKIEKFTSMAPTSMFESATGY
jgi:hypothetical protein